MKCLLGFVFILLTSCASTLSLDQKIAAAYITHTEIVKAGTIAVTAHTITSDQAQKVMDMATTSRSMLDEAKALETANPTGAQSELTLAITALTALQTYVNSQGAKP